MELIALGVNSTQVIILSLMLYSVMGILYMQSIIDKKKKDELERLVYTIDNDYEVNNKRKEIEETYKYRIENKQTKYIMFTFILNFLFNNLFILVILLGYVLRLKGVGNREYIKDFEYKHNNIKGNFILMLVGVVVTWVVIAL